MAAARDARRRALARLDAADWEARREAWYAAQFGTEEDG